MRSSTKSAVVFCALFGVIALTWIAATPLSAGPDEPDHVIRGAALVRGQLDGNSSETSTRPTFEVPAWVGSPDPLCFKHESYTPATCASSAPLPGGEQIEISTRSADYPIWGHLAPGVGTLLPADVATWSARILDALPAAILFGLAFAVRARRGWLAAGGTMLAITPMAWFMAAVVNPSGLVIAGGIALWVGIGELSERGSLTRWLSAAAWAALVLPRRDGLIWAVLILSLAVLIYQTGYRDTWRRLGIGPQVLVVASTLATMAWATRSDTASAKVLLVVPAIPFAVAGARRLWMSSLLAGRWRRVGAVLASLVVVQVVSFEIMKRRPGGYDQEVLRIVIGRTGMHLREAIGVLGWLDAPLPDTMMMLWVVALGVLVAAALVANERNLLWGAVGILGAAVASSWVLEMAQGEPTGTYWQGRYYLPMLAGIPLVLARAKRSPESARLGRAVLLFALVVLNVAMAATMRRWGVGIAGSFNPIRWNTYDAPIAPALLLVIHLAATVGVWFRVERAATAEDPGQETRESVVSEAAI